MDFESDFRACDFVSSLGKIHYRHHEGKGLPIIFIHGFAGSSRSWSRLVRYLPNHLNIYLLDLLGHGQSDAPDGPDYSLQMHYDILLEFIEKEKINKPALFGHSYGGWLAAYYAIQEETGPLIIEDPAGLKEFVAERRSGNPNYVEEMVRTASEMNPHSGVLTKMLTADNEDAFLTKQNLGSITAHTLIIWGEGDKTVDVKFSKIFSKGIRHGRLVVMQGEKHTPHYTNPEAVAKLVTDFLRS